jgi:hypothetical protein
VSVCPIRSEGNRRNIFARLTSCSKELNPLTQKRRERESGRIVEEKTCGAGGGMREALYIGGGGGRKSILLEVTQAMPARPS